MIDAVLQTSPSILVLHVNGCDDRIWTCSWLFDATRGEKEIENTGKNNVNVATYLTF